MTKKELKQTIDNWGSIFTIEHNGDNCGRFNYSSFLQYVKNEYNYWKKVDGEKSIENGYSESYKQLLDSIETIISTISDEHLQNNNSFMTFINPAFSGIEKIHKSSSSVRFDMCSAKDSANYSLRTEYCKSITNDDGRVISMVAQLYKGRSYLYSYLQKDISSDEFKAAITFIGLETKNIKRRESFDYTDRFAEIDSEFEEIKKRNEEFERDLEEFTDITKTQTEEWINENNVQIDEMKDRYEKRIAELENTYKEKLKLAAPKEYWENEATKMNNQYKSYVIISILLTAVVLGVGFLMVKEAYHFAASNINLERIIPFSFVMIGIISLLIYLLRTVIKIMVSSKHLETEYNQKAVFTYFFLTMLNQDDSAIPITSAEQSMIYQTLFSTPETGLLKGGDSGELNTMLTTIINRLSH